MCFAEIHVYCLLSHSAKCVGVGSRHQSDFISEIIAVYLLTQMSTQSILRLKMRELNPVANPTKHKS